MTRALLFLAMVFASACGGPEPLGDDPYDDPTQDDDDDLGDDDPLDCTNDVDSHTSDLAVPIEDGDVVDGILCDGELGTDTYRFLMTKPRMDIILEWEGDADLDVDYVFTDGKTVLHSMGSGANPEWITLTPGDYAMGFEYYIVVRRVSGGQTPYRLSLELRGW